MINTQLVKAFIRHRLKAKTRHGVHSPFVYHLIDQIIYDFGDHEEYADIERLRRQLLSDRRSITITDLGAGSYVNNDRQKQVRQLARNALKPPRLAQLIFRLAREFHPRNVVELGTCLGLTTAYLAKAMPDAEIITVEGCPQTAAVARENLKQLGLEKVKVLTGGFDILLPQILGELEYLDFIFIDGNHRKDATLTYFHQCLGKIHEDSVMIFDDIYWSKGMEEAWNEIREHPRVTVTVDLFWIGVVFFRKGQATEHFKVRF